VVAMPSDEWGETPVAFVVLAAEATADSGALKAWTNERVGKFQRLNEVVLVDVLPRSAIGKVLKRELRDRKLAADLSV
jgi:long-chain acyl-CoA synthetase